MPWVFTLRDLGEPRLPDGTPVMRPTVPLVTIDTQVTDGYFGVVDTGSPISVSSVSFAKRAGVEMDAEPVMLVPLGLGGRFNQLPVFEAHLALLSPDETVMYSWTLPIAVIASWRFSFDVLLGQRGWFDTFTTTFGEDRFAVETTNTFDERFGSPDEGPGTL